MQRSSLSPRFWLTALGIVILVLGFTVAYLIKTQALEASTAQYRIVGGQAYLSQDADSKQDADSVQKYGGTPAVIVAAYKRKLHNLLQGEHLAYLLAIVAVIAAACCFRMAWHAEPGE